MKILDREFVVRSFNRQAVPKPHNDFYRMSLPSGQIDVEIGCGVGRHSIQYAISNPALSLIAIEHTFEKFAKFKKNVVNSCSPKNLLLVHANAISWVAHMIPAKRVRRYFILYPNPNPKPGDFRKRWHCMPFMEFIIETLVDGGELVLATNCKFYAEEARFYLCNYWGLRLVSYKSFDQDTIPFAPRTHFEDKYLKSGQSCYDLKFSKN